MTHEDLEELRYLALCGITRLLNRRDAIDARLRGVASDGRELDDEHVRRYVMARRNNRTHLRATRKALAAVEALAGVRVTTIDALREARDREEREFDYAGYLLRFAASRDFDASVVAACADDRARTRVRLRRVRRALAVAEGWE